MNKSSLAPIVLFVYKRLDLLKKTIHYLKLNDLAKYSDLYIFSDSFKNANDYESVKNVRKYIENIKNFKKIKVILREKNYGLANNVISGIDQILISRNKLIVLEEDMIVSKNFLKFINQGLDLYKNTKNVASIHAYNYPIKFSNDIPNTFFIRGADCWGWGTWRRSWKKFEKNSNLLLKKIKKKKLENEFNFNGSYNYIAMLKDNIKNNNNSWAIRWYASAFLANMFTLYPKRSLVRNIGTSSGHNSRFDILNLNQKLKTNKIKIYKQPVRENIKAKEQMTIFFKSNFKYYLKNFIRKILNG
jgi:hypothetical protein